MGIEEAVTELNSILGSYTTAVLVFIGAMLFLYVIRTIVLVKLKNLISKIKLDTCFVDTVLSFKWPFYFVVSLYAAAQFIALAENIRKGINYFVLIVIVYYAIQGIGALIDHYTIKETCKRAKNGKSHEASIMKLLSRVIKIALWIVAALFVVSNLGLNISSLIAGLGIGGIAIALALQSILGDVFSALSIYLDKPFEVGDFIIIGSDMGTVKDIGIKSTRIQTLHGHELVVSNKELTSIRVNNYKQMKKRRVVFNVGVVYATPSKKLEKIPEIIKGIFKKTKDTELDRVNFREFGAYSLNYEIVYYMVTSDYNEYVKTQEKINLAVKREFEKEKIEMAFPTQTIYVNK